MSPEQACGALDAMRVRHHRLRAVALRVAEHLEVMADEEHGTMAAFLRAEAKLLYKGVQGDS